jgi:hypothetical protein
MAREKKTILDPDRDELAQLIAESLNKTLVSEFILNTGGLDDPCCFASPTEVISLVSWTASAE